MRCAFLWRHESRNIGDRAAGWPLYFPFPAHETIDLDEAEKNDIPFPYDRIVIGGGILPTARWFPNVTKRLIESRARIFCAGVGTNEPEPAPDFPSVAAGWRHAGTDDPCPCPSCMLPEFDHPSAPQYDTVYYSNPEIRALSGQPHMENLQATATRAIRFLARGKTVVTSSYHGAYWASLLGRTVIVASDRGKMRRPLWESTGWSLYAARTLCMRWRVRIHDFLTGE